MPAWMQLWWYVFPELAKCWKISLWRHDGYLRLPARTNIIWCLRQILLAKISSGQLFAKKVMEWERCLPEVMSHFCSTQSGTSHDPFWFLHTAWYILIFHEKVCIGASSNIEGASLRYSPPAEWLLFLNTDFMRSLLASPEAWDDAFDQCMPAWSCFIASA